MHSDNMWRNRHTLIVFDSVVGRSDWCAGSVEFAERRANVARFAFGNRLCIATVQYKSGHSLENATYDESNMNNNVILCPVDFSACSEVALELASRLAEPEKSESDSVECYRSRQNRAHHFGRCIFQEMRVRD